MLTYAFRGAGPSVFVSYSFHDRKIATQVATYLSDSGYRVQMEDEASLIGRPLDRALRERVEGAEAFVQILTRDASRSRWVKRELELAAETARSPGRVIAILIMDEDAFPSEVYGEHCIHCIAGIDSNVLEDLRRRVAEAVYALPLAENDPFQLDREASDRTLSKWPMDQRRVVIDSGGCLLRAMGDVIDHISQSSVEHKSAWLNQESRYKAGLIERLRTRDREITELLRHLCQGYQASKLELPGEAAEALNYFTLLRLGPDVIHLAKQLSEATTEFTTRFAGALSSLWERLPNDPDKVLYPFLTWRKNRMFPEDDSSEERTCDWALRRVGIDDKAFEKFIIRAHQDLKPWAGQRKPLSEGSMTDSPPAPLQLDPSLIADQRLPTENSLVASFHRAGPTTLISFDSGRSTSASRLAKSLEKAGCLVTLEPAAALQKRDRAPVTSFEVFVQLRAEPGTAEFLDGRFAEATSVERSNTLVIPVVEGPEQPKGSFADWVYVHAPGGLPEAQVDLVTRTALSAVHFLPLSKSSAFDFDLVVLKSVARRASSDERRIIIDSNDVILGSARQIVETLRTANENHLALPGAMEFLDSAMRYLDSADAAVRKLMHELHRQHQPLSRYAAEFVDSAAGSLARFGRLVLWRWVNRLTDWSTLLPERHREAICEAAGRLAEVFEGKEPCRIARWALSAESARPLEDLIELTASSPGRATVRWFLPRAKFGEFERELTTIGVRPVDEIFPLEWLELILPQLAAYASLMIDAERGDPGEQLTRDFAWNVDEYNLMAR